MRPGVQLAGVLLATAAVYARTLRFGFVYDDLPQIVNNPLIKEHRFVPQFFTEHLWSFMTVGWYGNYYRPMFLEWLQLNYLAFGLNTVGWHALAILVHLATTALVFALAWRLTADGGAATVAALLFGVHPAHVEAVAWVSGVPEALFGLCFLGAFLAYLRAREPGKGSARWTAAAVVLFAAAMLAKETAVVLPVGVIAYEYFFGERGGWIRRSLRASLPYWITATIYLAARVHALHGVANPEQHYGAGMLLLTIPQVLWFYVKGLVLPVGRAEFYDVTFVEGADFFRVLAPLLQVAAAFALLWLWARRSRVVAFLAIWMAVTVAPAVAGLWVFRPFDLVHDRYLYLPSVAFCILVALALRTLGERYAGRRTLVLATCTAVLTAAWAASTVYESGFWKNNLTLYTRAMQMAPENDIPVTFLGIEMQNGGRPDLAERLFDRALELNPDSWQANIAKGTLHYNMRDYAGAEKYLALAVAVYPTGGSHENSNQYFYLGMTEMKLGKLGEAEKDVLQAIAIQPNYPGYHLGLGAVYELERRDKEARMAYEMELTIDPQSSEARARLAALPPPLPTQ